MVVAHFLANKIMLTNLRVWHVTNPPAAADWYFVRSPEEAIDTINRIANQQLKLDWVYANMFGLEIFDGKEWTEWYHPEFGYDINEYEDAQE